MTFGFGARDDCPSGIRNSSRPVSLGAGEGRPACDARAGYLAVLALFCFGFLGFLAFLSTSTSSWLGRLLARSYRAIASPE
jgi:hypothetical protein